MPERRVNGGWPPSVRAGRPGKVAHLVDLIGGQRILVRVRKGALDAATKDVELMVKTGVLDDGFLPRTARVTTEGGELAARPAPGEGRPRPSCLALNRCGGAGDREQAHLAVGPQKA